MIDATQNPYVRETTWNWVKKNFHVFRELFQGTPYVSQLMQEVISRTGIGREEEVKDYVSKLNIVEAGEGIRKGLEALGHLLEPQEKSGLTIFYRAFSERS